MNEEHGIGKLINKVLGDTDEIQKIQKILTEGAHTLTEAERALYQKELDTQIWRMW